MKKYDLNANKNSIAVIGHFDGLVGQLEGWFESKTGYEIACYVYDSDSFYVNAEEEHKKRSCKTTDFPENGFLKGKPFIVSKDWISELKYYGIDKVLPMNPYNQERYEDIRKIKENNLELISAIHPSATLFEKSKIGKGVWIHEGVYVGYKVEIEDGVMLNTRAQIDHHSVLRECSQLDPGVVTASFVTCEKKSHVHMGSIIRNRITIGENSVIGMGSLVLKDIPANCTAYGHPAKIIKYH